MQHFFVSSHHPIKTTINAVHFFLLQDNSFSPIICLLCCFSSLFVSSSLFPGFFRLPLSEFSASGAGRNRSSSWMKRLAQDVLKHGSEPLECRFIGFGSPGLTEDFPVTRRMQTEFVLFFRDYFIQKESNMGGRKKTLVATAALMFLAAQSWAEAGPDTVELDSLANHYSAVTFDHAMHVGVASGCVECHHHTTGGAPTDSNCARCHEGGGEAIAVACRDCHSSNRFSAEDLAKIEGNQQLHHKGKPGLKGAYHQKCLGCHTAMGAPTGCQDCHTRNDEGDAFFHAGQYAPAPKDSAGHGGGH
jgi:hypothetical protein